MIKIVKDSDYNSDYNNVELRLRNLENKHVLNQEKIKRLENEFNTHSDNVIIIKNTLGELSKNVAVMSEHINNISTKNKEGLWKVLCTFSLSLSISLICYVLSL